MTFAQRSVDDVTIVELTPQLVTDVSKELFELTIQSLLANGNSKIILDLAGLRWMNSYALGLLVAAHRSIDGAGGSMALLNPNPRVQEMLKVVGMEQVWSIFDDEAAAVAALAS